MKQYITKVTKRNPWAWIPTLYFAQGLPYVAVMTISVIMYKRLGMSNTDIALYTGWLGLPWVIKPFWSPFVDIIRTKRWWVLIMQWVIAIALAGIAFTIPTSWWVQLTFAVFMLMGFASATHDIAADGFYMLALTEHEQSLYVGIRSTFYRIATVMGQGILVIIAGLIEMNSGLKPVEVSFDVNPQIAQSEYALPIVKVSESQSNQEIQFITSASSITIGVSTPETVQNQAFADFSQLMLDSVNNMNVINGFNTTGEIKDRSKSLSAVKDERWSGFRMWLSRTFGDHIWGKKSEKAADENVDNNIAIVAIRLNKKPETGKDYILNVSQKEGDTGIKLVSDGRLVFNESNWEKLAYLYYTIDHKIKDRVSAKFAGSSGNIPLAWAIVFVVLSLFFFAVVLYHTWALPKPSTDTNQEKKTTRQIFSEFVDTFKTFFTKFPLWQTIAAILFMLFYRFPEAQLTKIIQPFLLDPINAGGLSLSTGEVGLVYGTVGIIGLTIGGIIGGIVAAKGGLKKWLQPMAWSMSLTCLTFIYLAFTQHQDLLTINICVFVEQFGYGFGFTAYMLYLIYYSEGKYKTAHYAICTGFMALSMMTGMIAGWIQETVGYRSFFVWTMICCAVTIIVAMIVKVDPKFGLKNNEDNTNVDKKE